MKNKKLIQTHRHLTLVFTGVVFCIVMIIGSAFLGVKYTTEGRQEKLQFLKQVGDIQNLINSQENALENFQRLERFNESRKFGEQASGKKQMGRLLDMNFIVIDSQRNVVLQNILKQPRFNSLDFSHELLYTDEQTYIAIRDLGGDSKVIFYKEFHYGVSDAFHDFLILLILAGISGVLFYIIGYRFVEKALSPVEENLEDMTNFVHNAGHELKTPLAVMRGNLQVMQVEDKLDKKLLKKSLKEIDSANQLIEGLIELSEIGKFTEKSFLALAIEVRKAVTELGTFAEEKNINIENTVSGAFIVQAHSQELNILLVNILKNAIKYNKKGGDVSLSLHKNILSITDSGKGMPPSEQEKIFDRFYRSDTVRSEEGFGIGLSLVKKIADANNWKIELESEEGKGSIFRVIF